MRLASRYRAEAGVRLLRFGRITMLALVVLLVPAIIVLAEVVFPARTLTVIAAIAGAVVSAVAPAITPSFVAAIGAATAVLAGLILRIFAFAPLVLRPVEPAHGIDHAQVMFGMLIIGFSRNPIAHGRRFARQDLIFFKNLVRVATYPNFGSAAVEGLISLRLVIGLAAATTTTAVAAALAATLIIVRSHIRLLPK